jgi:flagellar protein FliS
MNNFAAMEQFRQVGVIGEFDFADPLTPVAMLFDGLLERPARARGLVERDQIREKSETLSRTIAIVDELRTVP